MRVTRDELLNSMTRADQSSVLCAINDYLTLQHDHYATQWDEKAARWIVSEMQYLVVQLSATGKKEPGIDPQLEDYRLKDGSAVRIRDRLQVDGRMALEEL